ncbi:MAG: TraX family protein [Clostridiaceae bacterium]
MEKHVSDGKLNIFNANQLKFIAIVAMLIDHIAWTFVPTSSFEGQLMHSIGRLTFPIMAFFIAEGFHKTSNLKKYFIRLSAFALISHIPFQLFALGRIPLLEPRLGDTIIDTATTSIMYTLTLGLLVLIIWKKTSLNEIVKFGLTMFILIIAIPGDYAFFGVLLVMAFGFAYPDRKLQLILGSIVILFLVYPSVTLKGPEPSVFMLATFIPLGLIAMYNGKLGNGRGMKWFYYIFYPAHLLILFLLKAFIIK